MFQIYRWKIVFFPWNVWRFSTGWNALRTAVRVEISFSFPELSSEFVVLVWSFHQVGSLLIRFQSCEIWESLVAKSGILWSSFTIFYLKAQRLCFFLCLSLSASANRCEHVLLKRWVKKKRKKKWTAGGGKVHYSYKWTVTLRYVAGRDVELADTTTSWTGEWWSFVVDEMFWDRLRGNSAAPQ